MPQPVTVMDLVLALDAARRDARVKGVTVRLGDGAVSLAEAEEIAPALSALRTAGKFVLVHASGFNSGGLGDYVAAASADAIWMPPKAHFAPAGTGLGEIFLRGLFDKLEAEPQIAKRAEYKSAADMYMEKSMTAPDREQLTRVAQSTYDSGVAAIAAARHLSPEAVRAALDASPQMSEEAMAAHLIDHIGYDDELSAEALRRAGAGAQTVKMKDYVRSRDAAFNAPIAIVEAEGEIRDGTAGDSLFGSSDGIASDDLSAGINQAIKDKAVKAIVLRVDSPGGSVSASDQILHAVKKAQAAGKKVVVSMGSLAASGGYYISLSADRIVAEPATLTGSIGVLTGKVSVGKTLGLAGVSAEEVSAGKNTLDGFLAAALHARSVGGAEPRGRCHLCRLHPEGGGGQEASPGPGAGRRPGPGLDRGRRQGQGPGGRTGRLLDGGRGGRPAGWGRSRQYQLQGLSPQCRGLWRPARPADRGRCRSCHPGAGPRPAGPAGGTRGRPCCRRNPARQSGIAGSWP